jgi:NADH-quinone oxidoreductase subunit M
MALVGSGAHSAPGLTGVLYQLLVFGLATAGFGLFAGIITDRVGHSRFVEETGARGFGGIAHEAPALALVTGIILASLLGFPGLAGFVGHSMIVIGGFPHYPAAIAITGFALLLATYYLFTMYRLVFLGGAASRGFSDLVLREKAYFLPLVLAILAFGLYPKPLLDLVSPAVALVLGSAK